ncbi:MAG TPA: hypothetical protein VFI49_07440 [Rudaea sp.]|nr:hypothetical protein [Rudaea sp.]
MAIVTRVEINPSFQNALNVEDNHQPIQVPHGTNQLQWNLIGNNTLQFYPLNDPNYPGFKWVDTPQYGIFDPPTLQGNGGTLQIGVNNNAPGGPWRYQLNAHDNMGVRYSTYYTTATATTNDPQIKNN